MKSKYFLHSASIIVCLMSLIDINYSELRIFDIILLVVISITIIAIVANIFVGKEKKNERD